MSIKKTIVVAIRCEYNLTLVEDLDPLEEGEVIIV